MSVTQSVQARGFASWSRVRRHPLASKSFRRCELVVGRWVGGAPMAAVQRLVRSWVALRPARLVIEHQTLGPGFRKGRSCTRFIVRLAVRAGDCALPSE